MTKALAEIKFFEAKGKDQRTDISRWRVNAYYAPHLAETMFFWSKEDYLRFIENHKEKFNPEIYAKWRGW